jgi:hypothetical protein
MLRQIGDTQSERDEEFNYFYEQAFGDFGQELLAEYQLEQQDIAPVTRVSDDHWTALEAA